MVYDSDFYTTRRSYSRPIVSSYTISTPRYYPVTETIRSTRPSEKQYSYSYSSTSESRTNSSDPYARPEKKTYTTERTSRSGPGGDYKYTSERTSTGGGPGGYSYYSTSSGRLPYGTTYRHHSYRV